MVYKCRRRDAPRRGSLGLDRFEAMKVFVTAVDEGSLAAAGRRLKRSPAAISRAIAALEGRVGAELLHRTTRVLKLSEAGDRYVAACRRVLAELAEADMLAAGDGSTPRGLLTLSAPPIYGEEVLRPILDDFLDLHPLVSARLLLQDHAVSLVDEGVDVALRIGRLPDSSLIATRIGADVRRVVVASPAYLAANPAIREPADLARHAIIAFSNFGLDSWTFPAEPNAAAPRTVRFAPRLLVNSVRAALASAAEGRGLTRLYSYHVAPMVQAGRLRVILHEAEFPAVPAHLLTPEGRHLAPKVRAFLDFATPRLRSQFAAFSAAARALT
jgi:DNA-binding transcriptional LysR family regulator